MGDNLLTTKEVLDRLKISRPTLYSLMDQGVIKPIETPTYLKRPARLQFRESDVERLLGKGKESDDSEDIPAA